MYKWPKISSCVYMAILFLEWSQFSWILLDVFQWHAPIYKKNVGRVTQLEKVPKVSSRCHTKRRTGARGPSRVYFGNDTDFSKKKKKNLKNLKKSQRPFFFWYDDSGHFGSFCVPQPMCE